MSVEPTNAVNTRTRDQDLDSVEQSRSAKRPKLEDTRDADSSADAPEQADDEMMLAPINHEQMDQHSPNAALGEIGDLEVVPLPPSHALLNRTSLASTGDTVVSQVWEADVGISEYVSSHVPKIEGIIKQRFTDFIVNEVDQDGNVLRLQSIAPPASSQKRESPGDPPVSSNVPESPGVGSSENTGLQSDGPSANPNFGDLGDKPAEWPENATDLLSPFMSETTIGQLKQIFLEGPDPPFVSDSGWGGRILGGSQPSEGTTEPDADTPEFPSSEQSRQQNRGRGRGRKDRGGRGGRQKPQERPDTRQVLSDPISDKILRTKVHSTVRELFHGKLDTETDLTAPQNDEGSRIVIRWARGRRGGSRGGRRGGRPERGDYPPYIHFTLQKTNRDTHDALGHLSRMLRVDIKDLSVAGTKDKRGVTTQRVSLRRGNKKVEDIWKLANAIGSRRSIEEAVSQRGERGVRIGDLNYRKASLELGMLKGNAFTITLRNVQVDSMDTLSQAMNSLANKGFINYYGMQRFGTAAIPTHTIGLCLLKADWEKAVKLILQRRPGEHPEVVAAREAWLVERDLDKALELMPRRVVAERCILESFQKNNGDDRNAFGALSTIPRNLRLMYVHAYQSYVWNAVVSERIKTYGVDKAVPGDLVFDKDVIDELTEAETPAAEVDQTQGQGGEHAKSRKPWVAPRVKTLTTDDVDKYSIFEVIMPLPGKDVAYPGGVLGDRYREFMRMDGLDPDNLVRKQKDYSLSGSYRKILQQPGKLSWSALRYTDPDVALAQADEDKLLGFDPPVVDENGKFLAVQVQLTLPTAAYATMALREVTKADTGSQQQIAMTQASEDQKYRQIRQAE